MFLIVSILFLVLIVGALADVITGEGRIRHLDKMTWILIIIFLPLIGSILWFLVGREYEQAPSERPEPRRETPLSQTERDLAALDREIAAHEKVARIARLEAELKARREAKGGA